MLDNDETDGSGRRLCRQVATSNGKVQYVVPSDAEGFVDACCQDRGEIMTTGGLLNVLQRLLSKSEEHVEALIVTKI